MKPTLCTTSSCSLNGENPYATIRDPPGLACKHTESSYVEMKSPGPRQMSFCSPSPTTTSTSTTSRNVYDVGQSVRLSVSLSGPVRNSHVN